MAVLMASVARGCPTSRRDSSRASPGPASALVSVPMGLAVLEIACAGQRRAQSPQPWQSDAEIETAGLFQVMALKAQASTQRPQARQREGSTLATLARIGCIRLPERESRSAALGSSASASTSRTSPSRAAAWASRTARVVFPAPPLPLRIATGPWITHLPASGARSRRPLGNCLACFLRPRCRHPAGLPWPWGRPFPPAAP